MHISMDETPNGTIYLSRDKNPLDCNFSEKALTRAFCRVAIVSRSVQKKFLVTSTE